MVVGTVGACVIGFGVVCICVVGLGVVGFGVVSSGVVGSGVVGFGVVGSGVVGSGVSSGSNGGNVCMSVTRLVSGKSVPWEITTLKKAANKTELIIQPAMMMVSLRLDTQNDSVSCGVQYSLDIKVLSIRGWNELRLTL